MPISFLAFKLMDIELPSVAVVTTGAEDSCVQFTFLSLRCLPRGPLSALAEHQTVSQRGCGTHTTFVVGSHVSLRVETR